MAQLFLGIIIAFLASFVLTPLTIALAKRTKLVDDPDTHNHPAIIHTGIIPRAGGLPIAIGILFGYLFLAQSLSKALIGTFIGAAAIVIIGLLDDRFDVSPYVRFVVNIIAAGIVVGFGVGIPFITNPLGGVIHLDQIRWSFEAFGGMHSIVILADVAAVLWIVWMMNAINWSSGVDGQLAGIVVIAAIALGLIAYRFAVQDPSQLPTVYLASSTAAAFLGFLPWSFYPQKIMPGYSGAALGGFLLAVLAIMSGARVATALIVLGVPMADGAWAIIRRLSRKQSPFRGDKEHLHHHLLELGWSKRSIALFYWGTCAMLGIVALSLNSRGKVFAVILLAIIFIGVTLWLRKLITSSKLPDQDNG